VYRRFVKHNYVLSFIHCHKICLHVVFFTVISPVNATGSSLNGVCRRKFHGNGIKLKTFPHGYVISLWGASSRRSGFDLLSTLPFFPSFFFFRFLLLLLLFSINIHLNICYLIECNKQQEEHRVSREKIVHRILNIWINNPTFYHFLQFTVGKPELGTIWSFSKQRSHGFFL